MAKPNNARGRRRSKDALENGADNLTDALRRPSADGNAIFEMWPESSTVAVRTLEDPVSTLIPIGHPLELNSYVMDKGAPGLRALTMAGSSMNNESIAMILKNRDLRVKFIQMLLADSGRLIAVVLKALAPGRDGIISAGTVLYNPQLIAERIDGAIASNGASFDLDTTERYQVSAILAELVGRALSASKTIQRTLPVIDLEQRPRWFPGFQDLIDGVVEYEITTILDSLNLDFRDLVTKSRFRLELLGQMLEREFRNLAQHLKAVDIVTQYMEDARILVRLYLVQSDLLGTFPIELLTNPNLLTLASNLTFVRAALEIDDSIPTSQTYNFDQLLAKVAMWLRSGPRFETRPMRDLTKYFGHYVIRDQQNAAKFAVAWGNHEYNGKIQAYHFTESSIDTSTPMYHPYELPSVEATLEQALAPATRLVTSQKIADFLISSISMSQIIQTMEQPGIVTVMLTESELQHYAAALAQRVVLGSFKTDTGEQELKLIYEVSWTPQNYEPLYGITGSIAVVTDPAEVIFLTEPGTAVEFFQHRNSLIPDSLKGEFILSRKPDTFMSKVSSDFRFNELLIGGQKRELKLSFSKLLGIVSELPIYTMVDGTSAALWHALFTAYSAARTLTQIVGEVTNDGNINYDQQMVAEQTATNFMSLIGELSNTPAVLRIVRNVMTALRLEMATEGTEHAHTALFQRATQVEVRTLTTLAMLSRVGYVNWPLMGEFITFLQGCRAFARYTSLTEK